MTYLSVVNFWKHQDKNAWKKAKYHPPWFKHVVHRDRDLDRLPLEARLLWWELLAAATRYSNVLEADLNWLSMETRINPETIKQVLPLLVKGGWLSETKTARRATKPVPDPVPNSDVLDVDVDVEEERSLSGKAFALATMITSGAIVDEHHLQVELAEHHINGAVGEHLHSLLKKRKEPAA